MRTRLFAVGPGILIAIAVSLMARPPATGEYLIDYPCWFADPPGWTAQCHRFAVPERRGDPATGQTSFPVVLLRPDGRAGHETPVLHLLGGPGQPAGLDSERPLARLGAILANQTWSRNRPHIIIDPRGVGRRGVPRLRCPSLSDARWSLALDRLGKGTPEWHAEIEKVVGTCRAGFVEKSVDLAAYTTAETARDLAGLRQALGVSQWDVFGVSYGTRLGLRLIDIDPDGVRAAILDGIDAPHFPVLAELPRNIQRSVRLIATDCAVTPDCNALFPALEQAVERIVERLRDDPIDLTLRPRDGDPIAISVGDEIFLEALEYALSYTDWLAFIPALITDFDQGRYALFTYLATSIVDDPYFKTDANGLGLSVRCSGEVPTNSTQAYAEARAAAPYYAGFDIELAAQVQCAAWLPGEPTSKPLPEPVASDIPALLLSGAYDTRTPAIFAISQLETLPNGHHLIIRDQSHGVSVTSKCARRAMALFLDDPEGFNPPACAQAQPRPVFATELDLPDRAEPVSR